jgi:Raf kinase inhibitor-like YbhB/YbcL family protein
MATKDPMNTLTRFAAVLSATLCLSAALSGCGGDAQAQSPAFTLSSPDLAAGSFPVRHTLNGFGCTGGNVSPELAWSNPPAGTRSYAVQMRDLDAPAGGLWHWAVYNIPGSATGLAQGAGNLASTLPAPGFGGNSDFFDTGLTGGNGNYGGPCPPVGQGVHRYVFTVYALAVDDLAATAGVPRSGMAGLYSVIINLGLGSALLGQASFTATYSR